MWPSPSSPLYYTLWTHTLWASIFISSSPTGPSSITNETFSGKEKVTTDNEATTAALQALPVEPSSLRATIEPIETWGWYADFLEEHGVTVSLADALRTKLLVANKCKNDKVNSRILTEFLQSGFLPSAYLGHRAEY